MQTRSIILGGAVAIPALLVVKHVLSVYVRIAPARRSQITETDTIPNALQESTSNRALVNPHGHPALNDTRYMDLDAPAVAQTLGDEALLAAFIRGFFGGRVFAPERALLRFFKPDMVNFSAIKTTNQPSTVWNVAQFDGDSLPILHTVLFGAFQVANIEQKRADSQHEGESSSSIDIVFGSDNTQFSGVHRFTVMRKADAENRVRICYAHIACNPTVNEALGPAFVFTLHKLYAMWLFREGVVEVLRRIRCEIHGGIAV